MDEWDIAHRGLRRLSSREITAFWAGYVARRGDEVIERGSLYSRWRRVSDDIVLSLYITNQSVGLFVRGQRGEGWRTTVNRLSVYEPELGMALGVSLRGFDGCCYLDRLPLPVIDPAIWPAGYDWLEEREEHYNRAIGEVLRAHAE